MSNEHVTGHFHVLSQELGITETKHPEDIYKTWLETGIFAMRIHEYDSARANLASSFVTGFVHAGFGRDKLMSDTKEHWVYKNKVSLDVNLV